MRLVKKKAVVIGLFLCIAAGAGAAWNKGFKGLAQEYNPQAQENDSKTAKEQKTTGKGFLHQAARQGSIDHPSANTVSGNRQEINIGSQETKGVLGGKRKSKIQLTEEEHELLSALEEAAAAADYEKAAQWMLEKEECLWSLYYEKMGENRYLYRKGTMQDNLNGTGLVIKKANVIYYGELLEGMPNGTGIALQVVHIDSPRFDYSTGLWKNGKMEGDGIIGYYYYEGAAQENGSVRRTGRFENDLMDGAVTYRTVNTQGEVKEWLLTVEKGKIVIDENWIYDEEKKVYQLPSQQNQEYAYVIEESAVDNIWFQNLIPW